MPLDLGTRIVARWTAPEPAHVSLLASAGIQAVVPDTVVPAFEQACRAAGIDVAAPNALDSVPSQGLWPGIRSQGRRSGDETASASSEPWVDANGYRAVCARVLDPAKPAVLAYRAEPAAGLARDRMVPFDTLELALVEARVNGGNYILSVDPRYREALLRNDPRARDAWASLGRTAAWLRQNASLFGRPALPAITTLIDRGAASWELANLLYRRNASPSLALASSPPPPSPDLKCLVACSLGPLPPATWKRIFDHASNGGIVVIDSPPDPSWKTLRKDRDRTVHEFGKGQVVAYDKRIADPSEFALDCIDLVSHRNRPARMWNAPAVIALACRGQQPGEILLHVVNYGSPARDEIQVRVLGHFRFAARNAPGESAIKLSTARRGTLTEVFLPELNRVAVIRFWGA
jgi:hypothetical protein